MARITSLLLCISLELQVLELAICRWQRLLLVSCTELQAVETWKKRSLGIRANISWMWTIILDLITSSLLFHLRNLTLWAASYILALVYISIAARGSPPLTKYFSASWKQNKTKTIFEYGVLQTNKLRNYRKVLVKYLVFLNLRIVLSNLMVVPGIWRKIMVNNSCESLNVTMYPYLPDSGKLLLA